VNLDPRIPEQKPVRARIKNTLVYRHLVDFKDEEYISRAAWTLEEATKLIESGFDYVCDIENARLFRKHK